jgi:hypothetical protein
MSELVASENSLPVGQTRQQVRERSLEEYAQAVDSYQESVLELDQAPTGDPQAVESLLARADDAKENLNQCRNRYHLHADMS